MTPAVLLSYLVIVSAAVVVWTRGALVASSVPSR
jgi:hypothetical protein